jgi:hypothetical protein
MPRGTLGAGTLEVAITVRSGLIRTQPPVKGFPMRRFLILDATPIAGVVLTVAWLVCLGVASGLY